MAHVAKYSRGATGHMLAHYDRSKDNLGDNVKQDMTGLNYNLARSVQKLPQLDFIHKRLSEVHCQNRKDVNVLCDWVVTAPKDLPEQEQGRFFQATYDFLQERYGRENVVSAYVHMDEVTPHVHFAFMPIVEDRRRGGYKVSAKEAVTRGDLRAFHKDLQKHVERELGHSVGILNGATREGNRSIEELKRQSAVSRLQETAEKAAKIVSKAQIQADAVNIALSP